MENELELLRRLHRVALSEEELVEIYDRSRDKYRVLFTLLQQPRFPEKISLGLIPRLFPMDLIRVIKNKRTNPYIRKRAEMEFVNKYPKYPLGEKRSYMKIAPASLLTYFAEEKDRNILLTILGNPYCTEELVLKMINRYTPRCEFYEILIDTEWFKRPQVAEAIIADNEAPIRILIAVVPFLNLRQLESLYMNPNTHENVKNNIIHYMRKRNPDGSQ